MAYNTAAYHGKLARVEKNDVAMDFGEGWNITATLDMADTSRSGQHWKEGIPGQASWTGSFTGQVVLGNTEQKAFVDNLVTATPGVKLTDVKFLMDGATNAYTGDIYIISYNISNVLTDKASYTFNFQGNGALAPTDSA